jgi:hypothetical protein
MLLGWMKYRHDVPKGCRVDGYTRAEDDHAAVAPPTRSTGRKSVANDRGCVERVGGVTAA